MRPVALALLLGLTAGPAGADRAADAEALETLFGFAETGDGMRREQAVQIDGCDVVLTTTVYADPGGEKRVAETTRFEIEHFRPLGPAADGALELTARDYFVRAGDDGLTRWLEALAETRADPDRAARMREIQRRVEQGEFGAFAQANGYESRSFLEGDPEPYYALPLPAVVLVLPPDEPDRAEAAWTAYAKRHCDLGERS